jgi:hypothetical protein
MGSSRLINERKCKMYEFNMDVSVGASLLLLDGHFDHNCPVETLRSICLAWAAIDPTRRVQDDRCPEQAHPPTPL